MWTTVDIAGKTADVFDPPTASRPRFALLYLHGIGLETLATSPIYTHLLETNQLACVCPHGQRSWWADRVCAEFDPQVTPERHLLGAVVPFFHERWKLAPRALAVQGICMGGQGVLRLAFKHPDVFAVVAAISPAVEY